MINEKNGIICFSLGREGGCLKYSQSMIDAIIASSSYDRVITFTSMNSKFLKPKESVNILTYNNNVSFLISSIILLPLYLIFLSLFFLFSTTSWKVYFPYFHYWSLPIIFVCRLFRVEVTSTIHDGILHNGDGKPLEQKLNKLYSKESDKLVFLTDFVKHNVSQSFNIKTKRMIVIPHGVIGEEFDFITDNKFSKKSILFFGRISIYKGLEVMLEAINKIDSSLYDKVYIVGRSQYDVDYSRYYGIKNIEIIDRFIDEVEVPIYFNDSSILVLPYLEATQSGVAMLGLASATPMIISSCGGLEEQFDEQDVLFFPPNDVSKLSSSIEMLLRNEDEYTKHRNALMNKKVGLEWASISKRLMEFIDG